MREAQPQFARQLGADILVKRGKLTVNKGIGGYDLREPSQRKAKRTGTIEGRASGAPGKGITNTPVSTR